jgi:hypothetical protein
MLAGGYSWRLYFYVEIAFAAALLIAAFFLVEESAYNRPEPKTSASLKPSNEKVQETLQEHAILGEQPKRRSYISTLKPWSSVDPEARFFVTMIRSFTYFFVPAVFWVVTSFGMVVCC